ncbi:MAG: RluA family pseudouridine synthase [Deltaproteobacteria bacterium]|nr:RluA family pseudouridine synthase [Deltaproteobacteria bacterium]
MKKMLAREETTLLALLSGHGYSKTKVKQLIKYRAVSVGRVPVKLLDHNLLPGDEVSVRSEKEMSDDRHHCPGLEIVYEDEAIIVIDKPAGLLTIATEKEKIKTAYYKLNACLKERSPAGKGRIFIVHRLDQGTSGLLVFAKNESAKQTLQDNWPQVDKKYAAIVEGVPREKRGRIASQLVESKALRVYSVSGATTDGKEAVTCYEVVKEEKEKEYALLHITLETGRKNQIRVHMADMGHPIAGDKKYGAKSDPLGRLALHAFFLALNHPVTGKHLEFQSRMPAKFNKLFTKKTSGQALPAKPSGNS